MVSRNQGLATVGQERPKRLGVAMSEIGSALPYGFGATVRSLRKAPLLTFEPI